MKRIITPILITLLTCISIQAQTFELYSLHNKRGMSMSVTNYGARIVSLCVPDRNGKVEDVVCGYDTLESYAKYKQNYGAVVGRYIGRILGAQFTLDGTTYHLDAESNGHCSHGGKPGFANRFWTVKDKTESSITLQYISPDGESGFPGELTLTVTMSLTEDNELRLNYEATTTKPTVLNPSNHSFFNISGNFNSTVLNQGLMIDADSIALYDSKKCVTGQLGCVTNTPFDFRSITSIGSRIETDDQQLKITGGYDHCYQLNHPGDINHVAARIYDPVSGRVMEVMTTEPALQIYSGNGLKANSIGKDGIAYARRSAICFETMHYADSPNKSQWPSTVLRPGETFHSQTIFKFTTDNSQTIRMAAPFGDRAPIYYEAHGSGTPVILLHGNTLDHRMWKKQVKVLSKKYRVIVPDFRGYGKSPKLTEGTKTTHADDIIALMDSLNIEKAHIIGLSMGGFVAADMLCKYPNRLISCVMASGSLRKMNGPSTPLDSTEIANQDKMINETKAKGLQQAKSEWIDKLVKGGGSKAESIRADLTEMVNDWDGWSWLHHEPHLWYANEVRPLLEKNKPPVPTLFLSGDKENKKRSWMMNYLPESKFVVIKDCGHMSNMERPKEFNKIILDFLKGSK